MKWGACVTDVPLPLTCGDVMPPVDVRIGLLM